LCVSTGYLSGMRPRRLREQRGGRAGGGRPPDPKPDQTRSPSPNQSPTGCGSPSPSPRKSPIGFGPRSPSPRESPIGFGPRSPSPRKSPIPLNLRARWTQESGSKKIGLCVLPWQKVATDAFNGLLGLPVTQKSGMWHWRRSQRPIWGQELAPSRLQPPTGRGYGRNSTGGWLADNPQGVPPRPRMCGGGGATRAAGKRGRGGAACRTASDAHPRASLLSRKPLSAIG
jgi:hypothetical protein